MKRYARWSYEETFKNYIEDTNDELLTFQDILKQEIKDGSLQGLRVEMSNMFADNKVMTSLMSDKMNYCDLADAVIALLTKGEK